MNKRIYIGKGTSQQEIVNILGAPIKDVEPMNSLTHFWGWENISKEKVKSVKIVYAYQSTGMYYSFTGLRRSVWQIGFDDNGNAICKHHY